MHDELKILDIEKNNSNFKVVFEVPGHHYDQPYPKRLAHSFPKTDHFFEELPSGKRRFEKILEETYLYISDEEHKKELKAEQKIDEIKDDYIGTTKKKTD